MNSMVTGNVRSAIVFGLARKNSIILYKLRIKCRGLHNDKYVGTDRIFQLKRLSIQCQECL